MCGVAQKGKPLQLTAPHNLAVYDFSRQLCCVKVLPCLTLNLRPACDHTEAWPKGVHMNNMDYGLYSIPGGADANPELEYQAKWLSSPL